jgi:hypothetical protein
VPDGPSGRRCEALYDVKFHEIDNPLQFGVVFLTITALLGFGLAFLGQMDHHEPRSREAQLTGSDSRAVP